MPVHCDVRDSVVTDLFSCLSMLFLFSVLRITNSAVDARWCVVFAQTIVSGVNNGIHGFLVPIRNQNDGKVAKDVRLEESVQILHTLRSNANDVCIPTR